MRELLEAAGAVFGSFGGVEVPRHFGDPAAEYEAALTGLAVADRSHRTRLRIGGKAPAQMLQGLVTGRIPAELEPSPEPYAVRAEYSAVLTAKGRIVTDLRLLRLPGAEAFLIDVPAAGADPLVGHLAKFLPPRLATTEDLSGSTGMLSVMGPKSAAILVREALGLRADSQQLDAMLEGDGLRMDDGSPLGITVVRSAEVDTTVFDVLSDRSTLRALWSRLIDSGARGVGLGVWETLRVEAGRPAFGFDMDAATLPHEAGIVDRAVDHAKGCYTGQEVVVRIRDRGQVNWRLAGVVVGDGPAPTKEAELYEPGAAKVVGRLKTLVDSPRAGGVLGLAYVRREVVAPADLRVGSPEGPEARLIELGPGWSSPSRPAT
jgi:folate-binding protein YgfZ